jgi:hypothetical protein
MTEGSLADGRELAEMLIADCVEKHRILPADLRDAAAADARHSSVLEEVSMSVHSRAMRDRYEDILTKSARGRGIAS